MVKYDKLLKVTGGVTGNNHKYVIVRFVIIIRPIKEEKLLDSLKGITPCICTNR